MPISVYLGRTGLATVLLIALLSTQLLDAAQVIIKPGSGDATIPPVVGLSPGRLELKLEKNNRVSGAFKLFNLSDKPITIQTSVNHWDLDTQNKIRHIAPTEHSLDQWLLVNPLSFTIAPKQSQTVRIAARPPFKPEAGEYRALLSFDKAGGVVNNQGIEVKFRLNAGVYVLVGEIARRGTIKQITLNNDQNKPTVNITVQSAGNANIRLNGQISVWPKTSFPGEASMQLYSLAGKQVDIPKAVHHIAPLPSTPVLAGTTRTLAIPFLRPPDAATVIHVRGKLGETTFQKTFTLP